MISYVPVFLIVVTLLILFLFLGVSEVLKKEAEEANRIYSTQVMKLIDQSLSAIDQSIINEIIADHSSIRDFFTPQQEISPLFQTYEASLGLNKLVLKHAIIDSVYLYRYSDQAILSKNRFIPLSEFEDKEFLQAQLTGDMSLQSWSGSRQYVEFSSQTEPISVITLVRSVILFSGEEGKIVTNVKITALQKILQDLFDSGISYAELVDGEGNVILSKNGFELERAKQKPTEMYLSDIHSPITNWHLRSGVEAGKMYYFISKFSYIWLTIGLSIVALGVIWIVYITRRNYRPVELMINQIQSLSFKISQKLATHTGGNQLSFIENAVENLIEESNKFQQRHEENIVFRKKVFFQEALEGSREITPEQWTDEMIKFDRPVKYSGFEVVLYEMDKFTDFKMSYNQKDQYLLKFILCSVIVEVAQNNGVIVWHEWMNHHIVGVLYQYQDEQGENSERITSMLEEVREWVQSNLTFTVTIGVGSLIKEAALIYLSYDDAKQALGYKSGLGSNRIIVYNDIEMSPKGDMFRHLQPVRTLSQQFRLGNPSWGEELEAFFDELEKTLLSREDVESILNYLIYQMNRELMELSEDYSEIWRNKGLQPINELLQRFDTLREFRGKVSLILTETSEHLERIREGRNNRSLLAEVRSYIEANYFDPDLSLNHLSDKFQINSKYVSQLFKEEFGENFVDYLAFVRIGHAKQLLSDTSMSVQDIAGKVGYQHSVSFNRVFKRLTGKTPVVFRSESVK